MRRDATRYWVFSLFFLSGITGLVYQIVWTRMLVIVFGNTLLATSTVLSAFMGGLAAGSFAAGRYIDRRPRPLIKIYALLEAGIGIFALLLPWLLVVVRPFYASLYQTLEGNLTLLNLARFGVCFALISVPTFLMGATLPVLLKRFVGGRRTIGNQVGFLYGLNTAGAVAGSLACGYLLLRVLGMRATTWVAVGINLGVAVVALWLARSESVDEETGEVAGPTGPVLPTVDPTTARMVLIGIGISGFCALAYEVFWTRMLNLFLHNNIYSFTAILATFLTGIAVGSLIYSRFLSSRTDQVTLFIVLQVAIGVLCYATPFVFSLLHESLFNKLAEALTLAKTAVIMLAPTVLMGISVPMAVQICNRGPRREGTSVGTVYAVNTIGAIFGAFAAGFVLLPLTGLHRGVTIVAGLNVVGGFLALFSQARPRMRPIWATALVATLAVAFLAAPADLFRSLFERSHPSAEIVHYKEGKVANVVVYDFVKSGYKDLHLNAVEEASSRLWHVQLFKLLGILPPMLHDEPDNALMVAFGAGQSAGACIDHVSRLDCVDLNPDIDGVAEVFTRENLDVIHHPRLNRIVNDGRNALLLGTEEYSLIISDATNPKMFDSWTLYTEEFYRLVQQRLRPGGIFCQWVLIPLPGDAIQVILNTFRKVFPHASFWCVYGSSQCLMLGTPERLEIDYQQLQTRLEPVFEPSGMADFGIDSTEKFLSFFLLGEDEMGRMLDGFDKISTDDLPHAQFHIEQDAVGVEASLDLVRHQESILPYLTNLGSSREEIAGTLETLESISRRLNLGFLLNDHGRYREAALVAAAAGLDDKNVTSMLNYGPEKKRYFLDRAARFPDDANAHNHLGYIYWKEKDYPRAIDELETAVRLKPGFAAAHTNLARAYADAGRFDQAVERLVEVRELNPAGSVLLKVARNLKIVRLLRQLHHEGDSPDLQMALGRAYLENGEEAESIRAVRAAAELRPDEPSIYMNLAVIYERLELLAEAQETYRTLVDLSPGDHRVSARWGELAALEQDREATRRWLNERLEGPAEETTDESHPPSCILASSEWNDFEFDGKIERLNLERAASLYEQSIAARSDDLHAYEDAATIHEVLGEYEKAAELWRQSLAVRSDASLAENNIRRLELLARLPLSTTGRPDAAGSLAEIGRLFRLNGDVERAIVYTERALEADPRQAGVWAMLADLLVSAGRYEDALDAGTRALELRPGFEPARKILDRLEPLALRAGG